MKDIVVYLNKEFVKKFDGNVVGFFEFVADLEGIFGSWNGIIGYEPMKNLNVLSGEALTNYNLPKQMRTILKLKKLVLKYGMIDADGLDNFIFARDKESAEEFLNADEGKENYICWTDLKEKLLVKVLEVAGAD